MESQDITPFNEDERNGNNTARDKNANETPDNDNENPSGSGPVPDYEALEYDMIGEKHLVIFNHYKYHPKTNQSNREHTCEDVKSLVETFTRIGFSVQLHQDKDRVTIWNICLKLRDTNFSAASCLFIAILTHGNRYGQLYAYDDTYHLQHVIELFEAHPTLAGKPKVFLIQACRGRKMDSGVKVEHDGEKRGAFYVIPSHADFLIMRSTVEDYISWRNERGSWMIQELCNVIRDHHRRLHILDMITIVHGKVAFAYTSKVTHDKEQNDKKQMIETTFTLTKFLKF